MVNIVELDPDTEVPKNDFSAFLQYFQEESGALLCRTSVGICAGVGLCLNVSGKPRFGLFNLMHRRIQGLIYFMKSINTSPSNRMIPNPITLTYLWDSHEPHAAQYWKTQSSIKRVISTNRRVAVSMSSCVISSFLEVEGMLNR